MLSFVGAVLGAIGRRGTIGFALSIVLGLALPQLAATARPLLPITIFCFTVTVFLRADLTIIAGLARRPARLAASVLWLVIVPPLIVGSLLVLAGPGTLDPGLVLGLALLGAAPPIMSSPAIAILYGFEPSLIIASVLIVTMLCPILAPVLVDLLAGQAVPLDPSVLMFRLLLFVGGGLVIGLILRHQLGSTRIAALKSEFDGFGVVMYFVFAIAAMDGVTAAALRDPKLVALFLAVAFGIAVVGITLGLLCLRYTTLPDRFILGYGTGQRNMGLLV
ncbi:MAG: hypothetical protein LCH61_14650, partial [Proteobacteria bacterium]|nr:hypothetical protein [Pseudomonadota bacterium]